MESQQYCNISWSDNERAMLIFLKAYPWNQQYLISNQNQFFSISNSIELDDRASMGCLHLQVDSVCLGHTLAPQKSPLQCAISVHDLWSSQFCLDLVMWWPLTFGRWIFRNAKQPLHIFFLIHKSCYLYIWMELWLQNCIFPIFDLWLLYLKFSQMLNSASTFFY